MLTLLVFFPGPSRTSGTQGATRTTGATGKFPGLLPSLAISLTPPCAHPSFRQIMYLCNYIHLCHEKKHSKKVTALRLYSALSLCAVSSMYGSSRLGPFE